MPHRSITLRCVAALKTLTLVTMAMTWRWRLTILHRTKPICSRSVAPSFSNPDFVEDSKSGAPLAPLNPETLYGGGAEGYTDYPSLSGNS